MSTDALESRPKRLVGPRDLLLNAALAVGLSFGIAALFGRRPLSDLLLQGMPWQAQAAGGAVIGLLLAGPLALLVRCAPRFGAFRRQMAELLGRADLRGFNPLWFSVCAGVGEEMLFRGALQPLLGLWVTSLAFTALHFQTGQFGTMNRMKALYALFVFLASLLLGVTFTRIGLLAAIVTHMVADIVALMTLRPARP